MSYKFNNHFAWCNFNEEVKQLSGPVRCLSFQGEEVLREIERNGSYSPNLSKVYRTHYTGGYSDLQKTIGYIPIWVFNPLLFGSVVSTVWDTEWFVDGSLWRRFIEFAGFDADTIHERLLLEFDVSSDELRADVVHDYGFCSICKEIQQKNLYAVYRLQYPDDDSPDWFYPTLKVIKRYKFNSTFQDTTTFKED